MHTSANVLLKHIPQLAQKDAKFTKEKGDRMMAIMTDMVHFIKGESEEHLQGSSVNQVFAPNDNEAHVARQKGI